MNKVKVLKIIGILLIVVAIGAGCYFFIGSKGDSPKNSDNSNEITPNKEEDTNSKSDFWLSEAEIPSETYELKVKILNDIAGTPIDLKKLDNKGYTFNYTEYGSGSSTDHKVNSISEVIGESFYSGEKEITVKNSADETVFIIELSNSCKKQEYKSYQEAINNKCWKIYLNEEKLFNKTFSGTGTDNSKQKLQEMFNQLGKPTHIFVRKNDNLTMTGNGVGQLSFVIVYDYGDFKLSVWTLDSYNKKYDYRMLNTYGLYYYTNEMYGDGDNMHPKDIINQLVK